MSYCRRKSALWFRALTPFCDLLELELVHLPRLVACRGWEFSHRSRQVMRGPRSPKAASLSHGKVSSRRRAVVSLHASPLIWHPLGKRLVSKKVHWKTCNPVQFFGNDKTWQSLISQAWFKGLHWQDIIVEKLYFLLLYLFFKTLQ